MFFQVNLFSHLETYLIALHLNFSYFMRLSNDDSYSNMFYFPQSRGSNLGLASYYTTELIANVQTSFGQQVSVCLLTVIILYKNSPVQGKTYIVYTTCNSVVRIWHLSDVLVLAFRMSTSCGKKPFKCLYDLWLLLISADGGRPGLGPTLPGYWLEDRYSETWIYLDKKKQFWRFIII